MRTDYHWKDYELIDASSGNRLERWGDVFMVRPDPQVIWQTEKTNPKWEHPDAIYFRSKSGGGHWEYNKKIPNEWIIGWEDLSFIVSPTNFKHTGVFPEQATNWAVYQQLIRNANREIRVLNLFGYTGIASLACLSAGASVCHVDSSKGMVNQAKRNAQLSNLSEAPCRWIVDDCLKFVQREFRRNKRYDAIIMDPPSYGRGPNGEIWKFEVNFDSFFKECCKILSDQPLFVAINSYSTGFSPSAVGYVLQSQFKDSGKYLIDEIGIPVTESGLILPCGNTSLFYTGDID